MQNMAEREKRNEHSSLRAHTNKSDSEREHAPHFERQHSLRSTCHNGHFHRARWRIPPREYVHTNKKYPAHTVSGIPHNMLGEVQKARWQQRGTPIPHTSA